MNNLVLQSERCHNLCGGDNYTTRTEYTVDVAYLDLNLLDTSRNFHRRDDEQGVTCLVLKSNGILVCVDDNGKLVWKVDLNSVLENSSDELIVGWFSVQILAQEKVACCLNRCRGAIATVSLQGNEAPGSNPLVELVGEFENGILAAEWSYDCQVLALVVNQEEEDEQQLHTMLITLTNQFEVLTEVVLESCSLSDTVSESSLASLSWRPDRTWLAVFTSLRRGGDSAEQNSNPSSIIRIYDPSDLALKPPALGRSEDGSGKLLQNLSGPVLAWAGSSCSLLLATAQSIGSKIKICLIESNGLAHGGFTLRDKKCTVNQMAWSPLTMTGGGATILAIHLSTTLGEVDNVVREEKVQLWYRSNYHWYLKQEFRFSPSTRIARLLWSTVDGDYLTILLQNGCSHHYKFRWQECITSPSHNNTALVVDGSEILLTPLAQALVPPPMSALSLSLEAPVRHISLTPPPQITVDTDHKIKNEMCDGMLGMAHLSDNSLVVFGTRKADIRSKIQAPEVLAQLGSKTINKAVGFNESTTGISSPCVFHSLLVISVSNDQVGRYWRIDCIAVERNEPRSSVERILHLKIKYSLMTDETTNDKKSPSAASVECIGKISVPHGRVLTLSLWKDIGTIQPIPSDEVSISAFVQIEDGQLFEYRVCGDDSTGKIARCDMEPLLEPCPWIVGLRQKLQQTDDHRIIGMSWRRRLYCGEVLLADSITSFHVSDRYLCFTTADASHCQLKFIAISQLFELDPFMGASDENVAVVSAQYEPRNIERGSRLITTLANKPMAVLQMPRGNLEGIFPRALVLPHVLSQLVAGNYRNAVEIMRQQKVDLNLLVDWNPTQFLDRGAKDLISQVSNVDHLNLFISSLRNENVTQTIHVLPPWLLHDFSLLTPEKEQFDFSFKVNEVCRKLRNLMGDGVQVGDALLLPVLSTYAKEQPPQLEAALSLIQSKALEQEGEIEFRTLKKKPPLFSDRAQSAFQYLAFLATYEMLFDAALGMYNIDLARAVARNSQMDPKEYIPLLERFRALPRFYSRYEIDLRLKRYPQALRNLVESSSWDEKGNDGVHISNSFKDCLFLIKKHKLHTLGLELFTEQTKTREILIDLVDRLVDSGDVNNALTVLLTIPEPAPIELILKAARRCQDWRTYFSYAVPPQSTETSLEAGALAFASQARDFAHEMVSTAATADKSQKSEILSDAARIMLDYGKEPTEAVDLLIQAELWSEAYRVATFHGTPALMKKCKDAAVSYAHAAIDDLSERVRTFELTMSRYNEMLDLRKEAYRKGTDNPPSENMQADESASLFSASSQLSHLTGASKASVGSTSSSASLSTVISVSSEYSSFSLSGADQMNRHKSKYNLIGQKASKQKKKKVKGRTKVVPGSERELEGLVGTLESVCLDVALSESFTDCITFLSRNSNILVAATMYEAYQDSVARFQDSLSNKRRIDLAARRKHEETARREGTKEEYVVHPLERNVEALKCADLSPDVRRLFDILPPTHLS